MSSREWESNIPKKESELLTNYSPPLPFHVETTRLETTMFLPIIKVHA